MIAFGEDARLTLLCRMILTMTQFSQLRSTAKRIVLRRETGISGAKPWSNTPQIAGVRIITELELLDELPREQPTVAEGRRLNDKDYDAPIRNSSGRSSSGRSAPLPPTRVSGGATAGCRASRRSWQR